MEERLLILKMLEEGKITAEEAMKLLETFDKKNTSSKTYEKEKDTTAYKLNQTINEFSKKAEKLADKLGPDFISKVENVSSDFAEAAVKFADKLVNYLGTGINSIDKYNSITKDYSFPVNNEDLKLQIKTQNIKVYTKSTNLDEIKMQLKLNLYDETLDTDKYINIESDEESLGFFTDFPSKVWGKLEVSIPNNIKEISIETTNAKCGFNDIKSCKLECTASNGKIEVDGCKADLMNLKTNNAKIQIEDTIALEAIMETTNANIEIENSSFDDLKSNTTNNGIYLMNFNSIRDGESNYDLQTTNGKIRIALPKAEINETAYKINAKTSLGSIHIVQLDPSYNVDKYDGNMKEEATITGPNFEKAEKKIKISAATTNSSITVLKS